MTSTQRHRGRARELVIDEKLRALVRDVAHGYGQQVYDDYAAFTAHVASSYTCS